MKGWQLDISPSVLCHPLETLAADFFSAFYLGAFIKDSTRLAPRTLHPFSLFLFLFLFLATLPFREIFLQSMSPGRHFYVRPHGS